MVFTSMRLETLTGDSLVKAAGLPVMVHRLYETMAMIGCRTYVNYNFPVVKQLDTITLWLYEFDAVLSFLSDNHWLISDEGAEMRTESSSSKDTSAGRRCSYHKYDTH